MTVSKCLDGLPKILKVGAYDWRVCIREDESDLYGQTDFETAELRLWPKNLTGPDKAVGIVIHECLHVIFDNAGLGSLKRGKEDREEQIVEGYEAGLISLFRDNPKLMIWMRRWL